MSKLERQLEEDRALRDAARGMFARELAHVKNETTAKALGERLGNVIGAKAETATNKAVDVAKDNQKALLGTGAAALTGAALWLFRAPLLSALSRWNGTCKKIDGAQTDPAKTESLSEDASDE